MSEIEPNIKVEMGSERNFGIVFGCVFGIIGLYPLVRSASPHLWSLAVALVFVVLAFAVPSLLKVPNKLWFKFGILLGSIFAPIVMAIVYFVTVVPTGLIMKAMGKDLLNQNLDEDCESYWITRDQPFGSMKDQF